MNRPSIFKRRGAFILETALELEAARQRAARERLIECLQEDDAEVHASFRVMLARSLYAAIHPQHPDLASVHVFGSSLSAARRWSDIDLLVHVAQRPSPLLRGLERVNKEITDAYAALVGPPPRGFRMFQFHVVTDDEVLAREGYGALVTSVHAERLRLGSA